MTPESTSEMRTSMHQLVEHVMRFPAKGNRGKWLQKQIAKRLVNDRFIDDLARLYELEYPYADIKNPYLSQLTQNYDKN